MNYQGDLQPRRFTFSQARPFFGGGFYFEATDKLYFRLGVLTGKIGGDDKLGQFNKDRNLNFQSKITEVHIGAEFDIFNSYVKVSPCWTLFRRSKKLSSIYKFLN